MEKLLDTVDRVFMVAVGVIMAVLVVVVVIDVAGRYGFGRSLLIANELSRMAFIWMTFLVMPLGVSRGLHVAVTTVLNALPAPARRLLYRAGILLVALLMGVVLAGAIVSIQARSLEVLNTLPVSAAWYYYPLAIGSAWSIVHLFARFAAGEPVERRAGSHEGEA